ncbi:MAG TPA: DnaJ domain-containing protein [Acidimicrobiales bacterium]|nr:DnaJ domain-containing protein [Acidimicrobiales bacterium]
MVTHYDVLGVRHDAEPEEIKRAFYGRARLYHPDAHASSPPAVRAEAERTMQALNSSWSVLRDPVRRRRYDRMLAREQPPTEVRGQAAAATASTAARTGTSSTATARSNGRQASAAGSPRRPLPQRPQQPKLGAGFQYWFGASHRGAARGLNLRVNGATSLEPLRGLVPDGLVGLHAEHTQIDDAELRNLAGMRSLRLLDLTGTRVTDAGLVHLLGCEDLEVVSLWDTRITDAGLALLGRLGNIRQLGLGNTRVTDAGLRHLQDLRRLRLVQLAGTAVEGPGLRHLHGLPELETVSLPWRVGPGHRRDLRRARPRATFAAAPTTGS